MNLTTSSEEKVEYVATQSAVEIYWVNQLEGTTIEEVTRCRRTDQIIRVQVQWRPASGRTVILEPI